MNADEAKKVAKEVVSKVRPFKKWLLLDNCHRAIRRAAKEGKTSAYIKHGLMYKDIATFHAVVEDLEKEGFDVDGRFCGNSFYIRWDK